LFGRAPSSFANPSTSPATAAATPPAPRGSDAYAVRGIYFKREWYATESECLTAAYAQQLPLEVCR